jgi:hypothetical protein
LHAYIEIIRADGRAEVRPLDADQITIGSGLEASIPIADAPELEAIHLLVAPREGGAWVSVAEGAEAAAWVGGKVHQNGLLTWGSEIDVGSLTLRINHAVVEEEKRRARRRRLTIIAALFVTLLAGMWLLREEKSKLPRRSAAPPSLFGDLPNSCPVSDAERALVRAESVREQAEARIVRYPFDSQDGVEAVRLYTIAQQCYELAGQNNEAAVVAKERDRIRSQIEEDYQVHLLRLSQVLRQGQLDDALRETRALQKLLEHREGPYRDWLIRLQRHIEIKLEKRGIKKSL